MQEKEFDYNGKKIFYRTKGSGPLVVLLHGFGEDGTIWKNQFDVFPNHQLLIPDLPGSGRSEAIDDMSMEGMAEAIAAHPDLPAGKATGASLRTLPVNDSASEAKSWKSKGRAWITPLTGEPEGASLPGGKVGMGRAILIGHSMGGYVTLAFAEKHPETVNAFGLFHSTAFADSEERKQKRRDGIAAMKAAGAEAFLKTFVPNLYSPVTKAERPGAIDEHLVSVRNFSADTLVSYFEAMMARPDRTAVLRGAKVPVLFVMGKQDVNVPVADGLRQCHLPQTAYIHLLQKSAHAGMIEETEEANKTLTEFVNDLV